MTIDEQLERQDAPTLRVLPGSYESRIWLAEVLRHACMHALDAIPERPASGRAQYVLGYLLAEAQLSEREAEALLQSVS
jgi:hypothetical protein